MKVLLFSDFHFHNYSQFSNAVPVPDGQSVPGLNERCRWVGWCVEQAGEVYDDRGCECALFGGDLMEARTLVDPLILSYAVESLENFAESRDLLMIPGNHDQPTHLPEIGDVLQLVEGRIRLPVRVSRWDWHWFGTGNRLGVLGIAAGRGLPRELGLPEKGETETRLLLMHEIVRGAALDNMHPAAAGIDLTDLTDFLRKHEFDWCFLGDVHRRQELAPRIWYIGSLLQKKFGEDQEKGVLILDTEDDSLDFVPLSSPEFKTVSDLEEIDNNNYYRLITNERPRKWVLPENVRVLPLPPEEKAPRNAEISLTAAFGTPDLAFEKWLASNLSKKERSRLAPLGKKILNRAMK